ncbi:MAG TPA: CHAT domain-containing protein, partial [Thermoanaerobaculia bacterium]|nr:CHAT domain-containing protein [Thermoanaerobaculia bacterium]
VVRPRRNPAQTRMLASALAERYGDQSFLEVPELAEKIRVTRDLATIDAYEKRAANYPFLRARCAWMRGYALANRNDFLLSLNAYDSAERQFRALHDRESSAAMRVRHAGVLTNLGQPDRAWQELLEVDQRVLTPKERQTYIGEVASAVDTLQHPGVALQYRQLIVQRIRNEMRGVDPGQEAALAKVRDRLGMALRSLANAEVKVGRFVPAAVHLRDAIRYQAQNTPEVQQFLDERMAEVNGRRLREVSPQLAPPQYTRAIELTDARARSQRARLLIERGIAYRKIGDDAGFRRDLAQAVDVIEEEQKDILAKDTGAGEALWSGYFSRFEDAYALLIAQNADTDPEPAFHYAESARAFEPLQRLKRLPYAPAPFQRIAVNPTLATIRSALPRGTFLLEYSVLDDRTYTWIVWHDGMRLVRQITKKSDVQRWTSRLQRAAARDSVDEFDRNLSAPYTGLIADPLAVVREIQPQGELRLVFISDRNMQGLPLAALRNSRTNRHLIQDVTIETQGSALLYVFSLMRDAELQPDRSLLLVGNPSFDRTLPYADGLHNLPEAENEAREIRELYGQAEMLLNQDATIAAFLEKARQKAIVHIAAHAVVNERQPHLSAILLARASDGDRGALDVQQLLRDAKLDRTRLVVLSACSSAGGAPVGPEGVGPLVRPLLASGVPAVLGTLWPVYDATAKDVLVSFERGFHEGSDAAAALRDAQRDFIREHRHALTWAPYQVIGHATSPFGAPKGKEKPP